VFPGYHVVTLVKDYWMSASLWLSFSVLSEALLNEVPRYFVKVAQLEFAQRETDKEENQNPTFHQSTIHHSGFPLYIPSCRPTQRRHLVAHHAHVDHLILQHIAMPCRTSVFSTLLNFISITKGRVGKALVQYVNFIPGKEYLFQQRPGAP
jgi:hypothetical protein